MTTGRATGNISAPTSPRPGASGFSTVDAAADGAAGGGLHVPPGAPLDKAPARRSLLGQALYDTFGQTGARVAAVWIGIVAVLGVFAPFLANSHPILFRPKGGALGSPLLGSLSAVDVALVVYFAFAVWVLLKRGLSAPDRLTTLAWPALTVAGVIAVIRLAGGGLTASFRQDAGGEVDAVWLGLLIISGVITFLALCALVYAMVRLSRGERGGWLVAGSTLVVL